MEKMFLGKLEDAKQKLEEFKTAARDQDKSLMHEIKSQKEENVRVIADRDEQLTRASNELNEIRESRDTLN